MTERGRGDLPEATDAADIDTIDLYSCAGHDAMLVPEVTDTEMVFAPSRDGISHTPLKWADCAAAVEVLARAMAEAAAE